MEYNGVCYYDTGSYCSAQGLPYNYNGTCYGDIGSYCSAQGQYGYSGSCYSDIGSYCSAQGLPYSYNGTCYGDIGSYCSAQGQYGYNGTCYSDIGSYCSAQGYMYSYGSSCYSDYTSYLSASCTASGGYPYGISCYYDIGSYCSAQGYPYSYGTTCYTDVSSYCSASGGWYYSNTNNCYTNFSDYCSASTGGSQPFGADGQCYSNLATYCNEKGFSYSYGSSCYSDEQSYCTASGQVWGTVNGKSACYNTPSSYQSALNIASCQASGGYMYHSSYGCMATKSEHDCRVTGSIWNSSTQTCYSSFPSSWASCVQTDGNAWYNDSCQNTPLAFTQIAVSNDHACGLTSSGTAYCWGGNPANTYGKLGVGDTVFRVAPTAVSGGLTFSKISAGAHHTCGITTSGAAYCWGYNGTEGRLGNNSTTQSSVPVAVSGGLTFSQVSAGNYHTCGITTSGAAYCWGHNNFGKLGNNSTTDSNVPVAVSGGLTFSKVSAGNNHTCGITTSGAAYCWGYGTDYQLGRNSTASASAPVAVSGGLTFTEIAAGFRHTCGIGTSGSTYCWGSGYSGELGGSSTQSSTPQLVTNSASLGFQKISAGQQHTCAITGSGTAYCWGSNYFGQTGAGLSNTQVVYQQPTQVSTTKAFTQIQSYSMGSGTCALTSSGEAYCWGMTSQSGYTIGLFGFQYPSVALENSQRYPMAVPATTPCGIPGYVWNNSTQTCVDARPSALSSFSATSNVLSWTPDNSGKTSSYRIWKGGGIGAVGYCASFYPFTGWLAPVTSTYTDSTNTSIETSSCYFIESCGESGCRASSVLANVSATCSSVSPQACTDYYSCTSSGGTWGSVDQTNYSCYANQNAFAIACSNNSYSYAYGGSCYSDINTYCSAQGASYNYNNQCYWDYNSYLCAASGQVWSSTTSSCYSTQDEANCAGGGGYWYNYCYYNSDEYNCATQGGWGIVNGQCYMTEAEANCAQNGGTWDGYSCQI